MTNVDNKNQTMKQSGPGVDVAIIGLGYIGLPTAAIVASAGLRVVGVDIRKSVVETVNSGGVHIEEPDLDTLVKKVVAEGRLSASIDIPSADVFIIAVPTPCDDEHRPDVGSVLAASRALAPALRPGNLIILESTSPVGTTEQVCAAIAEARPDLRVPAVGGGEAEPGIQIRKVSEIAGLAIRRKAVTPQLQAFGEGQSPGTRDIDIEAGTENDEVCREPSRRRCQLEVAGPAGARGHLAPQLDASVGMPGDALNGFPRGRDAAGEDVRKPGEPFAIRHLGIAVHETGIDDLLGLVDARHGLG
mgnify:CR=1 FL=1